MARRHGVLGGRLADFQGHVHILVELADGVVLEISQYRQSIIGLYVLKQVSLKVVIYLS